VSFSFVFTSANALKVNGAGRGGVSLPRNDKQVLIARLPFREVVCHEVNNEAYVFHSSE
jgi:hypothetical protein